ncbi:hypothetical protein CLOSTMETH_00895 [[Clostridium] methylpentosum DSM 5476]|uniref:Uncharacterized protein n=1 Tax=[Clostridium] methylpentosum DSM 5476 TaxID=537013 RepID=C0EAN2_9FIRM|nr:hypothetical protein CLOSTMETH_00895 [[Clostridium] methylpentosum DSM 5476]
MCGEVTYETIEILFSNSPLRFSLQRFDRLLGQAANKLGTGGPFLGQCTGKLAGKNICGSFSG